MVADDFFKINDLGETKFDKLCQSAKYLKLYIYLICEI